MIALKNKIIAAALSLAIISAPSMYILYKSSSPAAATAKSYIKHLINKASLPPLLNDKKGLGTILNKTSPQKDKIIYETDSVKRFVNQAEGFYFDVPKNFELLTDRPYASAESSEGKIVVSREWVFENNADEYIAYYLNRFILNPEFQKENNITLTENKSKGSMQTISAVINDLPDDKFDKYTYVFIKTRTPNFYRLMFKYKSDNTEFESCIEEVISSFQYFSPSGKTSAPTGFEPVIPAQWTKETTGLYKKIQNTDSLYWGIFTQDIFDMGIKKTIPALEKKLDYKFPVILCYLQLGSEFPLEFMNKNYRENRLAELTLQTTFSNNERLFGYTPFLDIYRGKKDEQIRTFARKAKEFGRPFLFRLNNEPNSDWTSYSAVVAMSDPDIYVDNWRRFYRIFKEEGVNNAIWIFNPNDRSYPPCNWNDFTAFYPGNEYVHFIGITGYNNGTYYKNEKWREFDAIYGDISRRYLPVFEKFPWIITEFSSSSIGGDKALWIRNMFKNLHKYPNIKIAVWFSYADFEINTDEEKKVSRPYWLDETEETLNEFKKGLQKYNAGPLFNH